VVGVFAMNPLANMGWIRSESIRQFGSEFWRDLFLRTHYGWAYAITGTGLGIAMAMTANGLRASKGFHALLEGHENLSGIRQMRDLIWRIMKLAARHAWVFPLFLGVAGF